MAILRKDIEDWDEGVKIREKLDYPQLIFLAIRAVVTAPNTGMYMLRVNHLRSLMAPYRKTDKKYPKQETKINEVYNNEIWGLDQNDWDDKRKIHQSLLKMHQKMFEYLIELADSLGLLGEKEITEHI